MSDKENKSYDEGHSVFSDQSSSESEKISSNSTSKAEAPNQKNEQTSNPDFGVLNTIRRTRNVNQAEKDDVPNRGNFLFTVGLPQRGKSTFQRHLLWYLEKGLNLDTGPEHSLSPEMANEQRRLEFESLRNVWAKEYREGRFPEATDINKPPTEFMYNSRPLNEDFSTKDPLNFGFFEISGEVFRSLFTNALEGKPGKLAHGERLDRFFQSKSKIVIVLLANGKNVESDDEAFDAFLQYLKNFDEYNIRKRTSIALVISYPEAAQTRILEKLARQEYGSEFDQFTYEEQELILDKIYRDNLERNEDDPEAEISRKFVNAYFSRTYSHMLDWNKGERKERARVFTFSVGEVTTTSDPKIEQHDFEDARAFYFWLYYQFKYKHLEKQKHDTWISNSAGWLKGWFSEDDD